MPSSSLRLYLDTAEINAWMAWQPTGIFHGVTTNPLLLERAGVPCTVEALRNLAQQAWKLGFREVQMQTWGTTVAELVRHGHALAELGHRHNDRLLVKVPISRLGTEAASQLIATGARVTFTALYEPAQVLIAAALGAEQAAPYLGRISDRGRDGRAEIEAMQAMVAGLGSPLRLLVASIRQAEDLVALAQSGLTTFTISPAIATALFESEATMAAIADFERAAQAQ